MLPSFWKPLRPHEDQSRLWRSSARFVAVCAGRGSGKTELARRRVIRYLPIRKPWPDPEYFYALPTMAQARRVAWTPLKSLIPEDWIESVNESTMTVITKFGSTLRVLGLDKAMRAEGLQYDGGVIDESSDQKPKVFDLTFRPALTHRRGWCWRIGVPKRFGVGAREYRTAFEKWASVEDGVHESYTWPSWTVLEPSEIEAAREAMDEKDFNEQFGAMWEVVSGLVYYGFSSAASLSPHTYDPARPIIVGSDFNVDPMAWVMMQQVGREVHVFDEIWIRNTNTEATLTELIKRYPDHKAGWRFFGDASGRARKTSASRSDYAIIKGDVRFKDSRVFYTKSNPPVADRVAAVNRMLKSALGERRLFISPRCVHTIRDLGYLSYIAGTRDIDKRDPDSGHIADALGYPIHYVFPVKYDEAKKSREVFIG